MRTFALALGVALLGCGGSSGPDEAKARLASDLVTCKNDSLTLKEQLGECKAGLQKAQEASTVKLDAVELKAAVPGQKRMEGNIPPEAVIKVVKQNSGGLRACYEHALKRKPDLQYVSSVSARFEVRNTGNAQNIRFSPRTDSEMERCMASTIEKWKFPAFQGDPVAFEQPVNLIAK
jgi:hypothetical protein